MESLILDWSSFRELSPVEWIQALFCFLLLIAYSLNARLQNMLIGVLWRFVGIAPVGTQPLPMGGYYTQQDTFYNPKTNAPSRLSTIFLIPQISPHACVLVSRLLQGTLFLGFLMPAWRLPVALACMLFILQFGQRWLRMYSAIIGQKDTLIPWFLLILAVAPAQGLSTPGSSSDLTVLVLKIILSLAYFLPAIGKIALTGFRWFDGTTIQAMGLEAHVAYGSSIGLDIASHPRLCQLASFAGVLWQLSFPLVCFVPDQRVILAFVVIGLIFHFINYFFFFIDFIAYWVPAYAVLIPEMLGITDVVTVNTLLDSQISRYDGGLTLAAFALFLCGCLIYFHRVTHAQDKCFGARSDMWPFGLHPYYRRYALNHKVEHGVLQFESYLYALEHNDVYHPWLPPLPLGDAGYFLRTFGRDIKTASQTSQVDATATVHLRLMALLYQLAEATPRAARQPSFINRARWRKGLHLGKAHGTTDTVYCETNIDRILSHPLVIVKAQVLVPTIHSKCKRKVTRTNIVVKRFTNAEKAFAGICRS